VGGVGNTTIASIIGTTSGTLTKDGAGTLTLTGANTYTGATTVSAGTLQIGNGNLINGPTGSGSISSSSAVSTAAGATLSISLKNNTSLSNNIANTGNVTFLSGGTTAGTGITNTYQGVISGTGSVTKAGIGIAIVNATQAYTGTTTISQGRLQIGTNNSSTGALSPSSAITNNGTLQFARGNTVTQGADFASVISGTGVVQQEGSGTLVLNGANTYTGATTVSFGTLQIGDGGTTGSLSTSSALTNNATLTFNRSNTVTQGTDFASVISGTGAVTQAGSGTLVLSGTNTYGGATTVSTGVLEVSGASGALTATSAVNINGGTLLLSGSAANRISNTAAISLGAATGSTLQFSGAVTETLGALTLAGGAGVRVIDFGATSGVLTFASLTAASSLPVQIWNWSGNLGIGGGTDRLFITSGAFGGSLAASDISFFSGPGTGLYSGTTAFTSGGELVPVPEASTLLAVLGLIAPLAWRERRHWMRCREARGN
jgi:fibronectin-binding autotransporter adhesin